jgi:hypothetical protein
MSFSLVVICPVFNAMHVPFSESIVFVELIKIGGVWN